MKFKKLLVLSVLSLFGANAWAAVPDGVWTMPEPQGLEFTEFTDDGTHYILYNPATKMFFASGNGWNTMASLRTFGNEIWLDAATEADAPEGSYELWNNDRNPARGTGEHNMFTDDGNSTWVDHGSQGNYSWSYEIVDGCVRFQNVALIADKPAFTGMYLGFDGTYVTTDNNVNSGDNRNAFTAILRHVDPTVTGASVDWKAVTVESYESFVYDEEAYNAYTEGAKTYIASMGLKKAIEDAEALSIDVAAALAVYTNTASTTDEMGKAQAALNEIVGVKAKLKAAIEDYEAKGFTATDAAKAVLADTQATKADVEKAQTELDAAFTEWGANQASVQNPVDMSNMIKNAHFDNGDATTGWSGDAFGRGGDVSDGAEHFSKNYNTYQKITGLAPGVYAVGVNGYYRAGGFGGDAEMHWMAKDEASKYAQLYATVGENTRTTPIVNVLSGAQPEGYGVGDIEVTLKDEEDNDVTVYAPNSMKAGDYYMHTLNQYANKLYVAVDETGELTIGVKKTTQIGNDWSMFDDFSLTYYGAAADAYQLMLDEALKDYGEVTIDEGTVYTEALLDAYKAALAGDKTATNQEEMNAIFNKIDGAYNELQKNIELWKTYQKTCEDSFEKYCKDEVSYNPQICLTVGDLGDYVDSDVKYVGDEELPGYETTLNEHKLNNEELQAEIDYVNALCEQIDKEAKEGLQPNDDVTRFLKNPDFESGVKRGATDPNGNTGDYGTAVGWHADKFANGNFTPGPDGKDNDPTVNHAFEAWHCWDFDLWQEVEGAPEGVYVIDVQGYVRNETNGTVVDYDPSIIPIKLYMNNSTSNFPDVFSEEVPEDKYDEDGNLPVIETWSWSDMNGSKYANSMGAAGLCFDWGMYKVHTYGLVKAGETMRIGVKGKMNGNWWCIWDNFKLTYQGYNVEYVKPALDEAMANIDVTKPMGKNVYDTAKGLSDKAAEAVATGDGKTMFQMLADVYDASAAIVNSVELFAKLTDAIENETTGLQAAIYTSANDNAKAEAEALVGTITSGIENHDFSDDEVAGLLEQIANMKTKLAMPADWESATDQNPADFTGVIVNPDFVNPDTDLSYGDGWTNPGNPGNDDTQKSAQAMEFWQSKFDMYQDLQGLPKGTYILQVDAWCRTGASQDAMNGYQENPDSTMAFVYAIGEDSLTFAAGVANLMKGAQTDDWYYDGIGEEILKVNGEDVSYYLPNSLVGGKAYMDPDIVTANEGVYTNKVIAKVGDDGKLRIGIKKDVDPANSWVVCDSWKLFYCGANSQLTPSGDLTLVETLEAQPARIEFYSVGGSRISKPGKGIAIMKKVMSDGSVKVQKVIIK